MQYVTQRFENTQAGLAQKDAYSRQMAAQGYHIVSEQLEAGHYKGGEQCCLFTLCMPCVFLAGRTPGIVVVTYGRDVAPCPNCGTEVVQLDTSAVIAFALLLIEQLWRARELYR